MSHELTLPQRCLDSTSNRTGLGWTRRVVEWWWTPDAFLFRMVEPQDSRFAGRATILGAGETIEGGEFSVEDMMQKIEAIPSNKRLLKQIGVRESVMRVCAALPRATTPHACAASRLCT